MSESTLKVTDLKFRIAKRTILNGITFQVEKGSVFAVVGHNGAGKTTLFHIILGLKFQTSGEILLLGQSNLNFKARKNLGYLPERPYLNLELTLRSFLHFHSKLMEMPSELSKGEISRVAKEVGLEDNLDHELNTFSKGMLQKTVLAQSILGDPAILILDEPMSGLDPEARESVRKKIGEWKQAGKTIIFSSHALEDVEQLSDRVLILQSGVIQFLGSVKEWGAQR